MAAGRFIAKALMGCARSASAAIARSVGRPLQSVSDPTQRGASRLRRRRISTGALRHSRTARGRSSRRSAAAARRARTSVTGSTTSSEAPCREAAARRPMREGLGVGLSEPPELAGALEFLVCARASGAAIARPRAQRIEATGRSNERCMRPSVAGLGGRPQLCDRFVPANVLKTCVSSCDRPRDTASIRRSLAGAAVTRSERIPFSQRLGPRRFERHQQNRSATRTNGVFSAHERERPPAGDRRPRRTTHRHPQGSSQG